MNSKITAVSSFFPQSRLTNEDLAALFEDWSADKIFKKTGIRERAIAGPEETAGDLAASAAEKLFVEHSIEPQSVDFLIFCTQSPDYFLPTTACLIHRRLGLRASSGAIDVNQGCSGFVYSLSLAKGLIASGSAKRVLILTADTYSKYIHLRDKSVRTLFGDAGAAVLVDAAPADSASRVGSFVFGTDGAGACNLIVPTGGARTSRSAASGVEVHDESGNIRSGDNLYMNGSEIMSFTLGTVPSAIRELEAQTGHSLQTCDYVVMHQANAFMLEALRKKLSIPPEKFPMRLEFCGNTVSSTIPLVLEGLVREQAGSGKLAVLVGFGVGYSWAACHVWL
jgi:3-oxoacyl-[acyl-carrier-protein] synthase-3